MATDISSRPLAFFCAILLNNVNNLVSIYTKIGYGYISSRDEVRQDTAIIVNFALFGEINIKYFSLLLKIGYISIVFKNRRDICKLLLISFKCSPKLFFVQFEDQIVYPQLLKI